jgi:hypothetical protein
VDDVVDVEGHHVPNINDAFGDDDKYFCDYLNYLMYGKPCDINYTQHYLMVVNVVALYDA